MTVIKDGDGWGYVLKHNNESRHTDWFLFGWNRQFTHARSRKPQTPSPPPLSRLHPLREALNKVKERHQKAQLRILGGWRAASSAVVASHPTLCLKRSAFAHIWAQAQLLPDTSSLLSYNLYNLPALVLVWGFSSLHLWD